MLKPTLIEHARLDLSAHPRSNVYTLVGLNESGKITILEAINLHRDRTQSLDPLNLQGYSIKTVDELIPNSKRSNFNGSTVIEAGYEMEEDDVTALKRFVREELGVELVGDIDDFSIQRKFEFADSKIRPGYTNLFWSNFNLMIKRKGARKDVRFEGEEWQKVAYFAQSLFPSILFFSNFLFDFPDRIYLEDATHDPQEARDKHKLYRAMLQDVLDAIGEDLDLTRHVTRRLQSKDGGDKQALDSTILKMGINITAVALRSWNQIFRQEFGRREIRVGYDQDDLGRWYLHL